MLRELFCHCDADLQLIGNKYEKFGSKISVLSERKANVLPMLDLE